MNSTYETPNLDQLKREFSTVTTDDVSTKMVSWVKPSPSISRKSRILSHKQSPGKNLIDDLRSSRTSTAMNRWATSKLPNLLPNSNTHSGTSESTRGRYDSKNSGSNSKFERQGTALNQFQRLPTLFSLVDPDDAKRIANLRRRQIYALNHLMRELEQDQFRQFCILNGIGASNTSQTATSNEPSNTT